jgi:transposase
VPRILPRRGIRHTIPENADSQVARLRRERYKKRDTVERTINRVKQSWAVATRYDKRGHIFLGTATIAALLIRLRS